MRHKELAYFINERIIVAIKKSNGEPRPWTDDEAISTYRFCNVYREWDTVSKYISSWLADKPKDQLITWAALSRYTNEVGTLQRLNHHRLWDPTVIRKELKDWRDRGGRVFNPAYIISTNGISMDKIDYIVEIVDSIHDNVGLKDHCTLAEAAAELMLIRGVGSFMAGQIVADLKHTPLLADAQDWWTWCAYGPGSKRGLSKVLGLDVKYPWRPKEFNVMLAEVQVEVTPDLHFKQRLDAQNFQNCLCEFDKWCRIVDGTGRPKQMYVPATYRNGH
jgi:hypothetical protein